MTHLFAPFQSRLEDLECAAVPDLLKWQVGPRALRAAIAAEVEADLKRCNNTALAQAFCVAVKIAGATVQDFLPRVLELPSGAVVCASLRFRLGCELCVRLILHFMQTTYLFMRIFIAFAPTSLSRYAPSLAPRSNVLL